MAASRAAEQRIDAVDFVKAAAIVAVAFTHAGVGPWLAYYSEWDRWLCSAWVNFQVPAFLVVSGFLYHRPDPISADVVRVRLARVVVPYLVASAVALISGVATATSASDLVFQLVTGSTLGIYYFIFLLVIFVPTIWALSRMRVRSVAVLCAGLWVWGLCVETYAYLFLIGADDAAPLEGLFWLMRSPLNYTYAMFVTGWLIASQGDRLRPVVTERTATIAAASALGVAAYFVVTALTPWATAGVLRMLYTFAVVGGIGLLTVQRTAPRAIRYLSEASLGLYLYHHMFQIALQPFVSGVAAPVRIVCVALGGLLAAVIVCRLGTALLGSRARVLLGA